ncbi:ABC transporter permease [Anaerosacchariphilus polymeriproducens]|uniref:ABC transporter permease n=1 Tax=Anaerosacchariphilus polymeriproducens TaxID=1812858 RepID=A0A371ATM0_9FIRM|nr:ABC transporter permease [Anaerosacchariphilus polymeriproducens]RDU22830.1 ABC transporter permease [Anaerosacchariphilus polymeriproducens]
MFFHLIKYQIKKRLNTKDELFWSLVFPILLGTFFFVSFGGFFDKYETFHAIPVAYVQGNNKSLDSKYFDNFLKELEGGKEPILEISRVSQEEADKLLKKEEIKGIIHAADSITLIVKEDGMDQSILKGILDQYLQKSSTINDIMKTAPEKLEGVINSLYEETNYLIEDSFSDGNMDAMVTYFYALIAMSCLYGCFAGHTIAIQAKANLSNLAARRVVSCTNKLQMILADFFGTLFVQFICSLISLGYLTLVLKVNFGNKMPLIICTILVGNIIGIATGLFISAVGRQSENVKMGIVIGITMTECFLSGLMIQNMRVIVEKYFPILNRINPASVLVDSFYSLNIYDTYERYTKNMIILLTMAAVLCILSYLTVRRERYASL